MREIKCGPNNKCIKVILEDGDAAKLVEMYDGAGFADANFIDRGGKIFTSTEDKERPAFIERMEAAGCTYTRVA